MSGEWSLKDLYTSYESAVYEEDFSRLESIYKTLNDMPLEDTLESVKAVIRSMEELTVLIQKLSAFIGLQLTTNTTDEVSLKQESRLRKLLSANTKVSVRIEKFIGSVTVDVTKDDYLSQYAYFFAKTKENMQYHLSDEVESVIATMQLSAGNAWEQLQSFLTSTVEGTLNNESVTLSEIRNLAYDKDASVRKQAYETELSMYDTIKEPVAFSLNNIKSLVNDIASLRGYENALDEALVKSDMSKETLDALLAAIRDALPSFRKYLKHKATLLGHKNGLPFYDLFAPIGSSEGRQFTSNESKKYLMAHFSKFSQDLADMTQEFYENNYIDMFPRKGKVGGAFCHNLPAIKQSRILTNFDGSLNSVVTMAHELGHAYHGMHIQDLGPLNWDYSMPVAETASTFNELLIMESVLNEATKEEKIVLLESVLQDATQIIVDIYSRYLFETAVFQARHSQFLFAKDLEEMMLSAQKEAYGDGLDDKYLHPYMWVNKPHYYDTGLSFYNFPYAFGGLFSRGLYAKYISEPSGFVEKYQKMLQLTTQATVEDTAKAMGVDVTTKEFWATGLAQLSSMIDEFIALTK